MQVTPLVTCLPLVADARAPAPTTTAILPPNGPQRNLVAPTAPDRTTAQTLVLDRVRITIVWTTIYSLHAICVAYLVAAGRVYDVLPGTQTCRLLMLYQLVLVPSWYPAIATVYYALAAVHACYLVLPLVRAAKSQLVTTCVGLRVTRSIDRLTRSFGSRAAVSQKRPQCSHRSVRVRFHTGLARLARLATRVYRKLFARDGLFGIHSTHFELYFLLREVVETMLQTYQAYTMTRLLPRETLNSVYTLILVVNCWTGSLLRRLCRGNKPLGRLLAVLCDIALDFLSSVGVPVAIAIGYLNEYDSVATDFMPSTLYYEDVWLLNFLNEMPIILFGSWLDAGSRLVFSVGLLLSLCDAKSLISSRAPTEQRRQPQNETMKFTGPSATALRTKRSSSRTKSRTASMVQKLKEPKAQECITKWVHRFLIVWGICVAATHMDASLRAMPQNCSLPLRPWFVSAPACAVVTMDCRKHPSLSGDAADFETVYSQLDAGSVEYVIFRHCPKVEFTPRFLTFYNLYGVKTYNSTLRSWNLDAAVTAAAHPRVRFVFLLLTQFPDATVPLGLQHELFPQTLTDIEIAVSNIERLPPTLPWPHYMTFYLEYSLLNEFPMVLASINPFTLSLGFNNITTIPLEALLIEVNFGGNPIHALPEFDVAVVQLYDSQLFSLSLAYTNLTMLPAWVTEPFVGQVEIRAAQSPICVRILQNASSPERETLLRERPWLAKVEELCGDDVYGPHGWYPLEVASLISK